jgi:Arc/MetJ-type ribon-helix-helix transcriptional regulator
LTDDRKMKREINNDVRISLRLNSEEKRQLEELINVGKYLNLSHAVRAFLKDGIDRERNSGGSNLVND